MADRDDKGGPPRRPQRPNDPRRPTGPPQRPAPPRRPPPPQDDDDEVEATAMLSPEHLQGLMDDADEAEERTMIASEGSAPPEEEVEERTMIASEGYAPPDEVEERTMIAQEQAPAARGPAARPPQPPARPKPSAELTVLVGPDEGKRFPLVDGVVHVGRSLDCEVVLNDRSASRKHFRLEGQGGRYELIDLGSENGTNVNGAQVRRVVLEPGAQIAVGTTLLHFGPIGAPAPAVGAPPPPAGRASRPPPPARPAAPPPRPAAPKSGGGAGKWIAVALVALVVLGGAGFVGGDYFGFWNVLGLGTQPPGAGKVAAADDEPTTGEGDDGEEAADDGADAADEGDRAEGDGTDRPEDNLAAEGTAGDDDTAGDDGAGDEAEPIAADEPDAGTTAAMAADEPDAGTVAAADEDAATEAAAEEDAAAVATVDEDAGLEATEDAGTVAAAEEDAGDEAGEDAGTVAQEEPDAESVAAAEEDAGVEAAAEGDLVAEAKALLAEKKVDEAQAKLVEATRAGVAPATLQPLLQQVAAAKSHQVMLTSQQKAVETGAWDVVIALAEKIPEDSPYAADSAALVIKAKEGKAGAKLDEAEKLANAGKQDEARAALTAATELSPEHPRVAVVQQVLDGGGDAAKAPEGEGAAEPAALAAEGEAERVETVKTFIEDVVKRIVAKEEDEKLTEEVLFQKDECAKVPKERKERCEEQAEAMAAQLDELREQLGSTEIAQVGEPEKLTRTEEWGDLEVWNVEVTMKDAKEPALFSVIVIDPDKLEVPADQPDALPEGLRVAWPVEMAPKVASTLNTRTGYRMYDAGDFGGARAYFLKASRDETLSEDDRKRAGYIAYNIKKFEQHYEAGMASAKALRPIPAISDLTQALKADRGVSRRYQGRIRKQLAAMQTERAESAFRSGRLWEAARSARKALGYDSGAAAAKSLLQKIDGKVDGLIAQAEKAKASGNAQKVIQLLRQVVLIVDKGDPRHRKAKALMDSVR